MAAGGDFENQRNYSGDTTLHNFATSRCVLGVELLIDSGVDVRVTRNDGATPLIALLTGNGRDGSGWRSNELEEIDRIVITAMASRTNRPADTDAISLHSQTEIHYLARVTALHMTTERRKHDIVKLLLENGANVFFLDGFGRTPLGRVLSWGILASSPKVVMFRKAYEALCVLLA